eukprot:UN20476
MCCKLLCTPSQARVTQTKILKWQLLALIIYALAGTGFCSFCGLLRTFIIYSIPTMMRIWNAPEESQTAGGAYLEFAWRESPNFVAEYYGVRKAKILIELEVIHGKR